jgi:hypothetical protein
MSKQHFTQGQLIQVAKLSEADMVVNNECRSPQTKLGLGYQLASVRLFNQFPPQVPFEPLEDIVTYMSLQLDIPPELIEQYKNGGKRLRSTENVSKNIYNSSRFIRKEYACWIISSTTRPCKSSRLTRFW